MTLEIDIMVVMTRRDNWDDYPSIKSKDTKSRKTIYMKKTDESESNIKKLKTLESKMV